jgi:hypothetical protein
MHSDFGIDFIKVELPRSKVERFQLSYDFLINDHISIYHVKVHLLCLAVSAKRICRVHSSLIGELRTSAFSSPIPEYAVSSYTALVGPWYNDILLR